ncbi:MULTISPECIES: hypothetical protein [unclassified Microbacterium]|uniref:hypothetical protein n=1 Tax=unclassified Microbacterium TaxID=2609290 RepID=UPI00301AD7A2
MSDTDTPAPRRMRDGEGVAQFFQVGEETVVRWRNLGYIRAYRLDGRRALQYDLDEIERAFKTQGPRKMRDGRKRGAKGRIVRLIVAEGSDQ